MQPEIVNQWQNYSRDAYEAARELQALSSKAFEQLAAQQIALVKTYVDTGVKQIGLLSEKKDLKDLFTAQSELASAQATQIVESVRKTTDILNEVRNEFSAWFEGRFNDATKAMVKATAVKKAA
jgi:phasin family protein